MQLALRRDPGPGTASALVPGGNIAATVLDGAGLPVAGRSGRTALARHLRRVALPGGTGPGVTGPLLAVTD
ncbi:hypothetical protein PFZ55_48125 [Streptomyces sp. MS2A]|nr:hypothetical protein [Streptomyces sp. CCM_MD2014]MDA4894655.1 hypothetical protein [Streptomyces sp. MS2A]